MADNVLSLLAELGVPVETQTNVNFSPPTLKISEIPATAAIPAKKGKLCLNMIVKNESKIIERLLTTVLPIIDTYCICDTGSTDNTADVIRAFMDKAGKAGEVYVEPFKNFGYNRTHALERAAAWGEYALLLDADMKLVIEPEFNKADLKENGYSIIQKNGSIDYYNTRIVKTGIGVRCVGPTHEYYDFPAGGNAKLQTLWINDIGDGGCKGDKFERDIRLLKTALETEPRNERYHFYLAQSYNHSGKKAEAYEYYKKRVELGGWIEEVFYAAMEAGNMARELGKNEEAVYWWLEAYQRHPKRSESLYEITKFYREKGKNRLSQIFGDVGATVPFPKDDVLFIKKACYDYLFDYEQSINSYYTGRPVNHYDYLNLIGADYNKSNVLSNYVFYVKKLKNLKGVADHDFCGTAVKEIGGRADDFVSSSPCIVSQGEGYLLNVRYVNYKIRSDGGYDFKHNDGKITTLNRIYWLGRGLNVLREKWLDKVADETLRYQGVEDVKVFPHAGELLFLGTVQHPQTGNVTVGRGVYDVSGDKLVPVALHSPLGRSCEKNWAYFHTAAGEARVVYEWSPLTVGAVEGSGLKIVSRCSEVPAFFRDVRGSSHGQRVVCADGSEEIWFLCHLVHYTTPRHYYHLLVILDGETLALKRHSILFKFHGECIEYALGLVVEPQRLLLSYSRMDRTSAVMEVPRDVVEKELFTS
jgi:glycosyltransferase involved in cell wall biosynthesis